MISKELKIYHSIGSPIHFGLWDIDPKGTVGCLDCFDFYYWVISIDDNNSDIGFTYQEIELELRAKGII